MDTNTNNVKEVEDFDFTFVSGLAMSITIERDLGDEIIYNPNTIVVKLVQKPSPINPEETLPAEDFIFYTKHLAAVQTRKKLVSVLTKDQKKEWVKTIKELGGTIH